jgi:hypothetical protein
MPSPNDCLLVLDDQATDVVQLSRTEAMIPRQGDRRQPEFGLLTVASHVNVHRLVAVETVEEEPVRTRETGNLRHVALALGRMISGSDDSAKSG